VCEPSALKTAMTDVSLELLRQTDVVTARPKEPTSHVVSGPGPGAFKDAFGGY
jgi:hypothetical protein